MTTPQPQILAPVPDHARYLECMLRAGQSPEEGLRPLTKIDWPPNTVIGLGAGLVAAMKSAVEELRAFPSLACGDCAIPSTQADLWLWITGDDPGQVLHDTRRWLHRLSPTFEIVRDVDGFKYGNGLDLSGYVDGTENPTGDDAVAAAIHDGASYVAVQQWQHDMDHFESLATAETDDIIGRRLSDNEEIENAPESAHVKRTAQESFEPEAFLVRRSMPWASRNAAGLMFVAFGRSHAAFEAQLRRMIGLEDGVQDGLFRFTRPITGGYYWCPPIENGRLDLSNLL